MWAIFKVFVEFVTILFLLFVSWFLGREAWGILDPQPRFETAPPALEGEVLISGPLGRYLDFKIHNEY